MKPEQNAGHCAGNILNQFWKYLYFAFNISQKFVLKDPINN